MPSKRHGATAPSSSSSPANTPSAKTTSASVVSAHGPSSTSKPSKSSKASKASGQSPLEVANSVLAKYLAQTPQRVMLIDTFMAFLMALGAVQFVYVVLAGNYPFNAFLSGFSATVGQFVLTASLRMQTNPENKKGNFEAISDERAFADYVFGSLILHLFCINFIN